MADDVREVTSAYHAHGDTELTLAPGDYVTILEGDSPAHEGWAFGKVGDREGWFPASSAARATRAEADPSSGPEQPALRRLRSLPGRLRTRLKATSRYDSRGENEVSQRLAPRVRRRRRRRGPVAGAAEAEDAAAAAPSAEARARRACGGPPARAATRYRRARSSARRARTRPTTEDESDDGGPRVAFAPTPSEAPTPWRRSAAAPLARLSVGALKRLAADRRVDIGDCVEKGDIVRALQSSIAVLKADQAARPSATRRSPGAGRGATTRSSATSSASTRAAGTPRAGLTCAICFDGPVQVAIFPCGRWHLYGLRREDPRVFAVPWQDRAPAGVYRGS
ncbi:hypothetical protein JL720_10208 [Aureococcus anophagefferens]|nr:hypothetical protein JL720_10208 [Aureococcus anophagefferens]